MHDPTIRTRLRLTRIKAATTFILSKICGSHVSEDVVLTMSGRGLSHDIRRLPGITGYGAMLILTPRLSIIANDPDSDHLLHL